MEINFDYLQKLYKNMDLEDSFKNDKKYLEEAFNEMFTLWNANYEKINEIKYVMIGEAPLWGANKKYIYNEQYDKNSLFFFPSNLEDLGINVSSKKQLLDEFIKLGIIVLDISPYALNHNCTAINYSESIGSSTKLNKEQYLELIKATIPFYFNEKIKLISCKKSNDVKVFFRYKRVKEVFEDLVYDSLKQYELVDSKTDILDISKKGGGVDREKLRKIVKPPIIRRT